VFHPLLVAAFARASLLTPQAAHPAATPCEACALTISSFPNVGRGGFQVCLIAAIWACLRELHALSAAAIRERLFRLLLLVGNDAAAASLVMGHRSFKLAASCFLPDTTALQSELGLPKAATYLSTHTCPTVCPCLPIAARW